MFGDTSKANKALKQFLRFRILNSKVLLLHFYKSQNSIFMKRLCLFFACFLLVATGFAQKNSGLGFNYQAVVRGLDGFVMSSKTIELRFSLMPGQAATQASWIETHNVKTDAYGTIGVIVGKGTKASGGVAANFSDVNFAAIHYWLKVEIKEGSNYRELSYTALSSVPYAEVATNAVPVGSVMPFAGDASKVPAGWLLCDGKAINRLEYLNLFNVIGTAWGVGDNATTFNLPDMRGMFLRGVSGDSGKDADAELRASLKDGGNSANNVGSYQGDAIRNIVGNTGFHGNRGGGILTPDGASAKNPFYVGIETSIGGNMTGITGNTQAHGTVFNASRAIPTGSDNRPQNVYVNYIIKY